MDRSTTGFAAKCPNSRHSSPRVHALATAPSDPDTRVFQERGVVVSSTRPPSRRPAVLRLGACPSRHRLRCAFTPFSYFYRPVERSPQFTAALTLARSRARSLRGRSDRIQPMVSLEQKRSQRAGLEPTALARKCLSLMNRWRLACSQERRPFAPPPPVRASRHRQTAKRTPPHPRNSR